MNFTFLICTERSGSNLITKILDAHPNICGPAPTHLFRIYGLNEEKYGDLQQGENKQLLVEDTLRVFEGQFGAWNEQFDVEEVLKEESKSTALSILQYMYEKEALSNNAQQVFVKELYTYRFVDYILERIPDAKFIYMVRDPRDAALSFMKSPSHQKNVVDSMKIWKEDQTETMKVMSRLNPEQIIRVRYEDLVGQPEETCKVLCQFLGEEYSDLMLQFYKNPLTKKNASRMAAWKNLDQPLISGNSNKFESGLTADEIGYVETVSKELMQSFGYEFTTSGDFDLSELKNSVDTPVTPVDVMPMTETEQRTRELRAKAIQTIINRSL